MLYKWLVGRFVWAVLALSCAHCAPSRSQTSAAASNDQNTYSRAELLNPQTCGSCHPVQLSDWQQSMHAFASSDPIFLAMQQQFLSENTTAPSNFCSHCHAPMAVVDAVDTPTSNLNSSYAGVTCYYCHNVNQVIGTHNNQQTIANDTVMRGPLNNPVANPAHGSAYSDLHDSNQLASSNLCGSCHDIAVGANFLIERTYHEWLGSVFAQADSGATCGQCHMLNNPNLQAIAVGANLPLRSVHSHLFPGVDIPSDPNLNTNTLLTANQNFLATTLQTALCVLIAGDQAQIRVLVDNVASGHFWPSGATIDRRAFAEVIAYQQNQIIYQSGVFDQNYPLLTVANPNDSDFWLLHDCGFAANDQQTMFFWAAQSDESNALPTLTTFNQQDIGFYQTHVKQNYPRSATNFIAHVPDKVTLRFRLQGFGEDIVQSLLSSGTLNANGFVRAPLYQVTQPITWTKDAATPAFVENGLDALCVTDGAFNAMATTVPAQNHVLCSP